MSPEEVKHNKPVDLTRLPRAERRRLKQNMGAMIPGRNLPYMKSVHGSVSQYNNLREKELIVEQKQHELQAQKPSVQ